MTFRDYSYAASFRDIVKSIVGKEISTARPLPKLGTVDTVDTENGICNVLFAGDDTSVPVKMYTVQPANGGGVGVGDVVRVEGTPGRRYVTEVVHGAPSLVAGTLTLSQLQSGAGSANVAIDLSTGVLSIASSSRKYKKNIDSAKISMAAFKAIRAVTFQDKNSDDEKIHLGFIAEELDKIDDSAIKALVNYLNGEPESVNYDRMTAILVMVVQSLLERVESLEEQLNEE